jgi:hypothetical protein
MLDFVAGKVQQCAVQWSQIKATDVIVDWVTHGVPLSFERTPTPFFRKNKAFKLKETQFLDTEIQQLVKSRALVPFDNPICVSPVNCVPKHKTFRLITDLRYLNEFCSKKSFQNEDVFKFFETIVPNDKLVSVDIKSGQYPGQSQVLQIPVYSLES